MDMTFGYILPTGFVTFVTSKYRENFYIEHVPSHDFTSKIQLPHWTLLMASGKGRVFVRTHAFALLRLDRGVVIDTVTGEMDLVRT